jgi:hypothetical protein
VGKDNSGNEVNGDREQSTNDRATQTSQSITISGNVRKKESRRSAIGLVPLEVLLEKGSERQDADLVDNLLRNPTESSPTDDVCEELDQSKNEEHETIEATAVHNTGGTLARVQTTDGVTENDSLTGESSTDHGCTEKRGEDHEEMGSDSGCVSLAKSPQALLGSLGLFLLIPSCFGGWLFSGRDVSLLGGLGII